MKLLVVSDSHGRTSSLRRAVLSHPEAAAVLFLGDGVSDLQSLRDELAGKAVVCVKGNNDWCAEAPVSQELTENGVRIFLTHGHAYHVKYGLEELLAAGKSRGAQIICFGHTHEAYTSYEDGIYLLNPGSVTFSGTYGLIELLPGGILTNTALLP